MHDGKVKEILRYLNVTANTIAPADYKGRYNSKFKPYPITPVTSRLEKYLAFVNHSIKCLQ